MPEFDTAFWQFDFPRSWNSEAMVINNKNQCLIPYEFFSLEGDSKVIGLESRFVIANLDVSEPQGEGEDYVDTLSCKQIQYTGLGHTIALHTFDDYFIVTGVSNTIKISSDFVCKSIYNGRLYKIIKSNTDLYAFSEDDHLLKSTNNGDSWTTIVEVDDKYQRLGYYWIKDKLIGYHNSQLFEISINEQGVTSKELKTDGLEGNSITSIKLYKGKVIVTSLSGVFIKDLTKFYEYKE